MNNLIIRVLALGITLILFLTSCSSDPSLQQYFVDSQEKQGFITTTIPKSILGLDVSQMSDKSQEAYNSIDKVNLLYYPIDKQNTAAFEKENAQLNAILKSDDFKTLMTHKSDGINMRFLYDGSSESIDEMIIYGSSPEMGLGVARVLGDDMKLGSIMKMMEEMKDVNLDQTGINNILKDIGVDLNEEGEIDEEAVKKIMASKGMDTTNLHIDMNSKE
ncbi:DUF4252 domain-containing protein [Nonlabens ulvanivorans]|uniref:Uncharacterized protein DUF4252 n=2 Tax=Nonlabens ulvanivorans TaxID=906888 RepID=A0A084JWY8_NONUL|nr:DUF4252 domain-containing protein [Nonlabens ulvanivorans]KEZ93472.1 hypothetical protein IL45_04450 [Nonlabens ulvanivorans]PRX14063.1 uncharacterized protein DUF4252 [Nonlabens ulvanivorans]